MATRMRIWLGLTVGGMALMAVWMLPIGSLFEEPERTRRIEPEQERLGTIERQMALDRARLERIRWVDSLSALVDAGRAQGSLFTMGLPEPDLESRPERVREEEQSDWTKEAAEVRARAEAQVEALVPHDGAFAVGVFLVEGERVPGLLGSQLEYYVGEASGGAYCLSVKSVPSVNATDLRNLNWWRPSDGSSANILGACAPFLVHGRPGPRIAEWLEQGNLLFATGGHFGGPSGRPGDPPRPLGLLAQSFFRISIDGQRCVEGDLEVCASLVTAPVTREVHPRGAVARELAPELWHVIDAYGIEGRFGWHDLQLFEDLEAEFGREAFGRFWRSELDVEPAFEAAFGVPLGQWVHDRAVAAFGTERRGHPLSAGNVLMALVAAGLAVSLAVGKQMRRRVA